MREKFYLHSEDTGRVHVVGASSTVELLHRLADWCRVLNGRHLINDDPADHVGAISWMDCPDDLDNGELLDEVAAHVWYTVTGGV